VFEGVEGIWVTAPRNCSRCGAALPSDVRWCGQCLAPVRELTPRAPIHQGNFVDVPHHAGPNVPHWSRWEASATTFGPVGRVGWTLAIALIGFNAVFQNPLMIVFLVPVALTLVHALWRPGWVVPTDTTTGPGMRRLVPQGPIKDWLLDIDEMAKTVIAVMVIIVLVELAYYGGPIVQFCAILAAVVVAVWLFFRRFFGRG
jgi:hypothetical protein